MSNEIKVISHDEWIAMAKSHGVPMRNVAFVCSNCGSMQSLDNFIDAGMDMDEARKSVGYSCIGRIDPSFKSTNENGKIVNACDWSLGGLLRLHQTEVLFKSGYQQPVFELAPPHLAESHALGIGVSHDNSLSKTLLEMRDE